MAAQTTGRADFAATAKQVRDYLVRQLWDGDRLVRARQDDGEIGRSTIEDYAYMGLGLMDYAHFTGEQIDLDTARSVVDSGWRRFRVNNGWRMQESTLLAAEPPREMITDSPLASPAAVLAMLAIEIGRLTNDKTYLNRAHQALARGWAAAEENAFFLATHIQAQNRLAAAQDKK